VLSEDTTRFAGLGLISFHSPFNAAGEAFSVCNLPHLISIQVFQVFVRFHELAPNDHRKRRHSQWQEIDSEHRQPHVLAISEQPLLPNGTFDFSVHNDALGCNGSVDVSPAGNDQKSAVEFAIKSTSTKPLGGYGADNLQS
jgi:hypothetical protein